VKTLNEIFKLLSESLLREDIERIRLRKSMLDSIPQSDAPDITMTPPFETKELENE